MDRSSLVNKYGELRRRLSAVETLMLIKNQYTYSQISSITKLPTPVLSRYVKGHVLPALGRADHLIEILGKEYLLNLIKNKIRVEENKIFDHSEVMNDIGLLEMIGKLVSHEFSELKVDKVLTIEVDGILPASQVARAFNVKLVVAKSRKEMGIQEFEEVRRVYSSGAYSYVFIPKNTIKKSETVLIVDDAIRTGSTLETLFNICDSVGAETVGVYALIGLKNLLSKVRKKVDFPVKTLIEL